MDDFWKSQTSSVLKYIKLVKLAYQRILWHLLPVSLIRRREILLIMISIYLILYRFKAVKMIKVLYLGNSEFELESLADI